MGTEGYKGFLDFKQMIKKKRPQCGNTLTYISWVFLLQTNTKQRKCKLLLSSDNTELPLSSSKSLLFKHDEVCMFPLLSLKNKSAVLFKTQKWALTAPEHRATPGLAQLETVSSRLC